MKKKDDYGHFAEKIDYEKILYLQIERTARAMSQATPQHPLALRFFESHVNALEALFTGLKDAQYYALKDERAKLSLGKNTARKIYELTAERFATLIGAMERQNLLGTKLITEVVK